MTAVVRFVIAAAARPWSLEFQVSAAFAAGVTFGLLLATGGAP